MPRIDSPDGVLGRIADATRRRVAALKKSEPAEKLRRGALYARKPADFILALRGVAPSVIAEIKFASPSGGPSAWAAGAPSAVSLAGAYLGAGARALSVLTEPEFFSGSPRYLSAVRERFPQAPILMKDFLLDIYQLEAARACGADAVLLIVALLGERIKDFLPVARELGLSALVEVHTEDELRLACGAGAELLGVNSRDLKTLRTDLSVARKLAQAAGGGALLVAESGIKNHKDIAELSGCGYGAFLIGTQLMAASDPGAALKALLAP